MSSYTEVRIDEHGNETHESWILMRANRVSSTGRRLFDSEIAHQHFVQVTITRCSRKRDLSRDCLYAEKILLEADMSLAQWGAFVSSFGDGTGVPATLSFLGEVGEVPQAPPESRLDQSHQEVREAGKKAVIDISNYYARVMHTFESGGGKRALREALTSLGYAIKNAPANMEFAAKSLTKHAENVVTKARADIEGMALAAMERGELPEGPSRLLNPGKESDD